MNQPIAAPEPRAKCARRRLVPALGCLALSFAVACAPIERRPRRAIAPTPQATVPKGTNWLSKNARGELVLPRQVDIHLTGLDGSERLEITDSSGRPRVITLQGGELALNRHVELPGPVMIDGHRHDGVLSVSLDTKGSMVASVRLPLEVYIAGVVAAELPIWSAEPAELEAQAIAARTFAAAAIAKRRKDGEPARLTDGVLDQAYRGTYDGGRSKGAAAVAAKLRGAIGRTAGLVVVRGDRLEETRYHAACGGYTASFADVFAGEVQRYDARGPGGRPCASCLTRAKAEQAQGGPAAERPLSWVVTLDEQALARLGQTFQLGGPLRQIQAARTDAAGRWLEARVASGVPGSQPVTVRFDDVRRALGYGRLKSAMLDALAPAAGEAIPKGAALRIQGRGRGHGVGLCQEGSRDYARSGLTAEEILQHYYPGTEIRRIKPSETP